MISLMEYAHATWLTKPNQDRAPVISVGVGKFFMALRIPDYGTILVGVTASLAKSTVSLQNLNSLVLRTILLLAHTVR